LNGTSNICDSGLAFSTDGDFLIQSGHIVNEDKTTIIKYDASDLTELWSLEVEGLTQGTPIVSTDKMYTFLVTNAENKTKARFIVIKNMNGTLADQELYQPIPARPAAYAPLGVARNPVRGNWAFGGGNTNDMLIWGELYVDGRGTENPDGQAVFEGTNHFYQVRANDGFQGFADLPTASGGVTKKVTLSAPVVPMHGQGAYFSYNSALIRGWHEGHRFGKPPHVKTKLPKQYNNPVPGPNCGTMTEDNSFLVVPGPPGPGGVPAIYGLKIYEDITTPSNSTSTMVWAINTTDVVQARPKTAFEGDILTYFVDGYEIVCVDTRVGEEKWRYDTGSIVLAELEVINDKYLTYVTTAGVVSLLQIGAEPTEAPTSAPSLRPTSTPTSTPSVFPSTSPSQSPSSLPSHIPTFPPFTLNPTSSETERPTATSPTSIPTTSIPTSRDDPQHASNETPETTSSSRRLLPAGAVTICTVTILVLTLIFI